MKKKALSFITIIIFCLASSAGGQEAPINHIQNQKETEKNSIQTDRERKESDEAESDQIGSTKNTINNQQKTELNGISDPCTPSKARNPNDHFRSEKHSANDDSWHSANDDPWDPCP